MKQLLTILILLIFFASCKTAQPVIKTVIKDSIITKDTTIYKTVKEYLPGETIEMWQAIPCPDLKMDTSIKKGKTILKASINKGILKMQCETDSLFHIIDSITSIRNTEAWHREVIEVPVDKPVPYIPRWVWFLIAGNVLAVAWKFRFSIIKLFT